MSEQNTKNQVEQPNLTSAIENVKKVSVVILNWNRKDNVLDCLSHIYKLNYPLYQLVVVDNASTDGSVAAIRQTYPDVVIVENDNQELWRARRQECRIAQSARIGNGCGLHGRQRHRCGPGFADAN